jgi:hypothetical protein
MTSNKASDREQKKEQIANHPLANLAGKFGGKFWEETLEQIEASRKKEKEEMKKFLDNMPSE